MDCSRPGLPVHHQLLEFTQTRIHWVTDVIQWSCSLSFRSPPTFNLFQHQGRSFPVNQFFASHGQTREEQKAITNSSRKNEVAGPKRKQCSVVDVSGGECNVQCCNEQYWIGSWSVQSMNQGKLDVVKQEIARVNIDILGICEWKWTRMGKFNSDDHYIYYCVQEYLKRNGVALKVNKKAWNTVFECSLKKDKIISFIPKANHSTSTVIQVYAPTINSKETEANWFDEVLQHLELIPKKDVLYFIGGWNEK